MIHDSMIHDKAPKPNLSCPACGFPSMRKRRISRPDSSRVESSHITTDDNRTSLVSRAACKCPGKLGTV